MRYASIFLTILFIWVAVILMAITHRTASEIFELYLSVMICTIALFLIGFRSK